MKRAKGQALVEFAIVLPVIVFIVLGILDVGRAVYSYNTLAESARQAARMAIVDQHTDAVQAVGIASGATLGLAAANVDVCFKKATSTQTGCSSSTDNCSLADRTIGCLAIVRAHLSYQPMTPVLAVLMSSISLSSTSVAPIEYVCPTTTQTTCP